MKSLRVLINFKEDDQVKLKFWMQKDMVEKIEILLFTKSDEDYLLGILEILNQMLEVCESLLVNGKNLIKVRIQKSLIPKRLKELNLGLGSFFAMVREIL